VTRSVAIGAALLVAAAVIAGPAAAQEPRASLPDVEDEVMCTICGTLLEASQSPQADRERALIRNLIAEGKDKDQIKDALVAEYGPRVLATPSGHGFDLLAWLFPVVGIALAAAALLVAARRISRERTSNSAAAGDIPSGDQARLDEDMARHEL
jgi:cytochrome c-type biogenesis protein CcmH/NrfF